MVIGDKLKELRETKEFSQGDIEKRTGIFAAIFPALRTVIRSRPLIRLRRWPAHSKFRCTGSSRTKCSKETEHPSLKGRDGAQQKAGRRASPICESIVANE